MRVRPAGRAGDGEGAGTGAYGLNGDPAQDAVAVLVVGRGRRDGGAVGGGDGV